MILWEYWSYIHLRFILVFIVICLLYNMKDENGIVVMKLITKILIFFLFYAKRLK